jgi:hypothetical protein
METFPAFKEWALVCEALGTGRQNILIRKGGIAEGKAGFRFLHQEFFLFPTWFHEQLEKTILEPDTALPLQQDQFLEIRYLAVVEWTRLIDNFDQLQRLREFHILHDTVLHERFHWDETPGVHVALVRVFRLDPPHRIPYEKKYGGCRSWLQVPSQEGSALVSVLSDEAHDERRKLLEEILGSQ